MSNPPSADVYRAEPLPIKVGILMDMPERINKFAFPSYELVKDAGEVEGHFTVPHASFALHCEFASREDWRRYVDGPIHKEMSALIADWRLGATVLQGYA